MGWIFLALRTQLVGVNVSPIFFLGKLYMTMLKQMGGCFVLIGKKSSKLPLYKKQKLYLEETELMESMLMKHTNIKLYNSQDKDLIRKVNSCSCSVE